MTPLEKSLIEKKIEEVIEANPEIKENSWSGYEREEWTAYNAGYIQALQDYIELFTGLDKQLKKIMEGVK